MGTYATSTVITVVGTVMLLPVAMLPILAIVTRRYGALRGWPLFAAAGLLASAVALAAFTIFPLPDPGTLECTGGTLSSYWQTDVFGTFSTVGDALESVGFPAVLVSTAFLQLALNVLLFVPYGFFLHQVSRWQGMRVVGVGLATSALIEVTQGTGVFGLYPCPYRVLDVDDLIVNTLGVAIGVLISFTVAQNDWSHPIPVHDLQRPTVPRRVVAAAIDLGLFVFLVGAGRFVWERAVGSTPPPDIVFGAVAAFLLVLAVPLLRLDRATPGQVIVNIAPTHGPASNAPASTSAILIRAGVRWVPIVLFGIFGLLAVAAVELAIVAATKGRRSAAGLLAHTSMRTKPAIAASGETVRLFGGNMAGAVIRVGDTVRKPHQRQSGTVQRLVAHARERGVTWAAEPLGMDENDDDVWRYIPGEVDHGDPGDRYSDALIIEISGRLRQWHDATASFLRRPSDVWWQPGKFPAEVICHVDFAPYNHVFRDGRFAGVIDFDTCYPGPRLWDIAYTAYRYVPLTPDADDDAKQERLVRLDSFLAAYTGGDPSLMYSRAKLLGYLVPRLNAMADWCEQQDSADRKRDAVMYRSHAQWIANGGLGTPDLVAVPNLG